MSTLNKVGLQSTNNSSNYLDGLIQFRQDAAEALNTDENHILTNEDVDKLVVLLPNVKKNPDSVRQYVGWPIKYLGANATDEWNSVDPIFKFIVKISRMLNKTPLDTFTQSDIDVIISKVKVNPNGVRWFFGPLVGKPINEITSASGGAVLDAVATGGLSVLPSDPNFQATLKNIGGSLINAANIIGWLSNTDNLLRIFAVGVGIVLTARGFGGLTNG